MFFDLAITLGVVGPLYSNILEWMISHCVAPASICSNDPRLFTTAAKQKVCVGANARERGGLRAGPIRPKIPQIHLVSTNITPFCRSAPRSSTWHRAALPSAPRGSRLSPSRDRWPLCGAWRYAHLPCQQQQPWFCLLQIRQRCMRSRVILAHFPLGQHDRLG